MIKFFRSIRQKLLSENKLSKYLLYAIGEIVLVVIGILIALQINNQNEARKERAKEVNYLKNVKTDLQSELANSAEFAAYHFGKAEACSHLLNSAAPQTIEEVQLYTDRYEQVFIWDTFVPNNNTFKELLSSGNLSLIKNDSIKNGLLELEKLYAEIATGEFHMRREYEVYLYDINIENTLALTFFDLSEPAYGLPGRIGIDDIPKSLHGKLIADAQWQHNNQTFTNGLRLAFMNNSYISGLHKNLTAYVKGLIQMIEEEINR
ncbi:DUF6090 family protein [Robiginitalea sp. IMCC43444]|uniref:DUF6090 family protein n=1 Tax=Robiginitalea sp. IMCC43444 TaxID=3459121 RepID=UPI0040411429